MSGYIHEMFKLFLCRFSTRFQMALGIPAEIKCIRFYGQKNYCPVSLLYVVSKIFEKLVNNRIVRSVMT